jgi:hypothetical protein
MTDYPVQWPSFPEYFASEMKAVINEHKVARLVTFPDIPDRLAPGKTGSAAKPALISTVIMNLGKNSANANNVTMRAGVWNSTGTSFSGTRTFTLDPVTNFDAPSTFPDNRDGINAELLIPRTVFSGVQYYIGALLVSPTTISTSPPTYYYGVRNDLPLNTAFDRTPTATSTNFSKDGDRLNVYPTHLVAYTVLPKEPLLGGALISGDFDLDILITWTSNADDGGSELVGYRIQRSKDNGATWSTIVANTGEEIDAEGAPLSRAYVDTNLTPGVTYGYRVASLNAVAIAHGPDYSGPYSEPDFATIPEAEPGNALSLLTATVTNPEPLPIIFSDFGPGIRFTDIQVQYGSEFLYTQVEATTQDSFAELQVAEASESKALYGVRTYSLSNLLNSTDAEALEVAKDYLTYYYQPELRVQSITVDLSNLTIQEKLQVLGLEIDSFISVSFTPNGVGDPKITSGLVTGIAHRISITTHEVELRLRNQRNLFTLNSDSKGILNVNTLGP